MQRLSPFFRYPKMFKNSGRSHLYIGLAELPIPASAFFQSPNVIRVSFSKRDHERDMKRAISKTIFVAGPNSLSSILTQDASDVQASVVSPSKLRTAVLRKTSDQDKVKQFVEIWSGDRLEASQEVTATHGAFYTDDAFSSLSFSPSENALIYTAEALDPISNNNKDADSFETFRYTPQFGEGFPGKKRPTLYLFQWKASAEDASDTSTATLTSLSFPKSPVPVLLGQAVFASENCIIATGYEYADSGRLLGVRYCVNRPAGIWMLRIPHDTEVPFPKELEVVAEKLTTPNRSARSPRILPGPSGRFTVFWLSNEVGGAHASCTSVHALDFSPKSGGESKLIVDTVWEPLEGGFPGLYTDFSLPSQPFVKLGSASYIAVHSVWGSRSTVLLISIQDGQVKDLTPDDDGNLHSWTVLGTDGQDQIVCTRSSPSIPHEVVLGRLDSAGIASWQVLSKPSLTPEIEKQLATLQTTIIPIPDRHPVETILMQPTISSPSASKLPCVCIPHGGPHSCYVTSFSPSYASLVLEGYTVSLVNYTGSTGFGETYIRKLLGRCGTLDVQDCMASVDHLIAIGVSESGPGKQFIQGGSHGGFLSAHLIGQYPDVFSGAVIRNPVISCGEISTTDIPDWYFAEFGLPYGSTTIMTPPRYATLFAASPISHVDNVRAPVLLFMGEVDLRVSPTNSMTYYHALKSRGKVVEMLAFPKDSHPLENVETSRICWEASRDWFAAAQKLDID